MPRPLWAGPAEPGAASAVRVVPTRARTEPAVGSMSVRPRENLRPDVTRSPTNLARSALFLQQRLRARITGVFQPRDIARIREPLHPDLLDRGIGDHLQRG